MVPKDHPEDTEATGNFTPDCPDCGSKTEVSKNQLTPEEYTSIIDCPNCAFVIESESNLAAQEKRDI